MMHLIDGMNIARRLFENYGSSQAMREALSMPRLLPPNQSMIWCWDSPNGSSARRSIYPEYKTGRVPPVSAFPEMVKFLKDLLKHTRAMQVTVSGYEADDIIAYFACGTNTPVKIRSNDRDFCQLLVLPHVQCEAQPKGGMKPEFIRLYKTLVGDPSDTISGLPGFGQKSWERLSDGNLRWLQVLMGKLEDGLKLTSADLETFAQLGVPKKSAEFLRQNPDRVKAMWKIVGFMPLKTEQVMPNLVVGREDYRHIELELNRFYL